MSSVASTRLRLEKQGTGENNNSWGTKLNAVVDLVDAAIAGMASYSLSGTKTLTSSNYIDDEARKAIQNITGGTGGTVTIPSLEKVYVVRNGSSGDVIFTTGTGTSATVKSGDTAVVFCDAASVYLGLVSDFGAGLPTSTGTPTLATHLTTKTWVESAITTAAFGGLSLGTGVQTFLQTPSSANFRAAVTDETGSGAVVFSTSPTLVAPALGTPTVLTLTNATGLPVSTGISGLATNVATFLGVPTSANLRAVLTDETGTGAAVFGTSPTIATPTITAPAITGGTVTSATLASCALVSPTITGAAIITSPSITTPTISTPTLTGTPIEGIYTIPDVAAFEIDPGNASIQQITLGTNRTPKGTNFLNGQSITLAVVGTAFALTWTDTTFGASGVKWMGGSAPTLATSGLTWITLWKVAGQVYGSTPGSSA